MEDESLYINQKCASGWVKGRKLDLSVCQPTIATCHSFISTEQAAGTFTNYTETLPLGSECTVKIDASNYVGRVIFDDSDTLGVEVKGYKIGKPITVKAGEV